MVILYIHGHQSPTSWALQSTMQQLLFVISPRLVIFYFYIYIIIIGLYNEIWSQRRWCQLSTAKENDWNTTPIYPYIVMIVLQHDLKNDNWDLWCYKGLYMSKKLLVLEFIKFMLSYQHLHRAIVLLLKYIKCYRKGANFEWYRRYVDYLGLFCKYDFFQMQEQQLVSLNFGREPTSFWGDLAAGICSQFYKIYLQR